MAVIFMFTQQSRCEGSMNRNDPFLGVEAIAIRHSWARVVSEATTRRYRDPLIDLRVMGGTTVRVLTIASSQHVDANSVLSSREYKYNKSGHASTSEASCGYPHSRLLRFTPQMTPPSKPLPTLPTVAARLLSLMAEPDVGVRQIGDTIRLDPSLTGKVIRAVNSLQYNIGRPIADIDRAVVLLGKRTISTLALTFSLSDAVTGDKRLKKFYQQYWTESVVQGLTSELLAKTYCPTEAGQFFSAGLLQDLGRLYLLQNFGDDYAMLMEIAQLDDRKLIELEQEAFETTHPDLTAGMLTQWQFPQQVIFAAAAHHQFRNPEPLSPPALTLEHALQIAARWESTSANHTKESFM